MIQGGIDVNRRDHVGRTPLHVTIFARSVDIAYDLVDAGSRMTARLVDGRTCLYLAAQFDQLVVVRNLLERSAFDTDRAKETKRPVAVAGGEGAEDEVIRSVLAAMTTSHL